MSAEVRSAPIPGIPRRWRGGYNLTGSELTTAGRRPPAEGRGGGDGTTSRTPALPPRRAERRPPGPARTQPEAAARTPPGAARTPPGAGARTPRRARHTPEPGGQTRRRDPRRRESD